MKTRVLFSESLMNQVHQLADLLYSPEEQLIQLETEHEWVTESWIATSQVKYGPLPYRWWYREGGRLVKHEELFSVTPHSHQILHFPLLSSDDRIVFLQKKIEELYDMILDQALIQKVFVWQARYVSTAHLLAESIRVLQRAIVRARLTNGGKLELDQIKAVIEDWQHVKLSSSALQDYLRSYVVGQDEAIDALVAQYQEARVFILLGPPYSGRKRLARAYASWLNGAARFCVSVDLSEALVSYSDLLHSCPDTVFLVKNAEHFPDRLQRLLDLKARVMILLDIVDEEKIVEETQSLETILYHNERFTLKKISSDQRLEHLQQRLPKSVLEEAVPLWFAPLSLEVKRVHMRRILAKQLADWSMVCGIPFYFQEEVIAYLLTYWQGIDAFLSQHVFPLFQRVLAHKVLEKNQALQLQLNETGTVLMVVIVHKRSKC